MGQSYLATDHRTRFEISADGKTCRMQVMVLDKAAERRGEQDYRWKTIVWFRDVGRPAGMTGPETRVCPYCLMDEPTPDHVKNCHASQSCVNCGYMESAHSTKARREAHAIGFLVDSCDRYTPPKPSMLGPAQRTWRDVRVHKRVDRKAAGHKPGVRGRSHRSALRNIEGG